MAALPTSLKEAPAQDAPGRTTVLALWAGAYGLFAVAYASAIRLSSNFDFTKSLLGGVANSLPEALAAPLVLRAAAAPASRGARHAWRLGLMAVAFAAWCLLGTTLGLAAMRAWETGSWRLTLDARYVPWKVLFSLLVFGVFAGLGRARFHARRAREASARALRAETLRAEARLAILRAQLNPHFILNVLHSLVGLAGRDPGATSGALERLGTALRYALRVQSAAIDRVSLREELDFTREYLDLEKLRLGDRLQTRFSIDESLLARPVPPFVLQPLVENAVLHAIAPREGGGVVSIRIERDAAALLIHVDDDGPGGPADAAGDAREGAGLGLRLLRDRLDALYRGDASLGIDRSPLGGRRASLRLVGEPSAGEEADRE